MSKRIILDVRHVSKTYESLRGKPVTAVEDITMRAHANEFISLVGPSGCGKTTLLKLLSGLLDPTHGTIKHGKEMRHGVVRGSSIVFQQKSLFPWLNVEENISYGLNVCGVPRDEQLKIAEHYIGVMGLRGFERSYPNELSGGMQQRVALARALATNPKILFLDEPFADLDVQTKRFMQDLLLQIWESEPRTVVLVTHDVEEAVFMSDTIYVMHTHPGKIREKITVPLKRPRDLKTEFSEKFLHLKKHVQEIVTKEALDLMKLDLKIYKNL